LDLRPAAITAYHRRAFEGDLQNAGLRITFDTLVSSRLHALTVNRVASNRLIIPEGWAIMEVKANEAVPDWVTSLLARHDCQLTRVSKYCAGVALIKHIDVLPLALSPGIPFADTEGQPNLSPPDSTSHPPEPVHG
jgi:SPX domain protein involved in polyphosphate accumulation